LVSEINEISKQSQKLKIYNHVSVSKDNFDQIDQP